MSDPVPLWLDCDPGHDDTFAILLAAYHPGIRLLGLSTVHGNASLEKTTVNALSILTAISKQTEIPVYPGARSALNRPAIHAPEIHGESGLDGTDLLPQPSAEADLSVPAVEAMAAALKATDPGTAWVTATGAATNVAALFLKYPELKSHVKGVSLMGGSIGEGFTPAVMGEVDGVTRIGNYTPWAEFNVLIDPEAAASILEDPILSKKSVLVPLDLTHLCLATDEVQNQILYGSGKEIPAKGPDGKKAKGITDLRQMLVELLNFFADTYRTKFGITAGPPLHDPLAVAVALHGTPHEIPFYDYLPPHPQSSVSSPERFDLKVVIEGTLDEASAGKTQTGRTLATLNKEGEGVRIPRGLDIAMFWNVTEECCQRADQANAKAAAKA